MNPQANAGGSTNAAINGRFGTASSSQAISPNEDRNETTKGIGGDFLHTGIEVLRHPRAEFNGTASKDGIRQTSLSTYPGLRIRRLSFDNIQPRPVGYAGTLTDSPTLLTALKKIKIPPLPSSGELFAVQNDLVVSNEIGLNPGKFTLQFD